MIPNAARPLSDRMRAAMVDRSLRAAFMPVLLPRRQAGNPEMGEAPALPRQSLNHQQCDVISSIFTRQDREDVVCEFVRAAAR